jgi:hypothetical protein
VLSNQIEQSCSVGVLGLKVEDQSPLLHGVFVLAGVFEGVAQFQVQGGCLWTFVDG